MLDLAVLDLVIGQHVVVGMQLHRVAVFPAAQRHDLVDECILLWESGTHIR